MCQRNWKQMKDCRGMSTPMDLNVKLSAHDDIDEVDAALYRKLVGSLIWLMNSQMNVRFLNGMLSSFMSKSLKSHK